jgi:hypothetical protein
MFRQGLIKIRIEYTDSIENLANETRQYKYTKAELIAKKLQYDLLIKNEMKNVDEIAEFLGIKKRS